MTWRTPVHRPGLLADSFRAYEALSQRGKGGVYLALDVRSSIRECVLKEGRRHGETEWDGRDGRFRVEREGHVLSALRRRHVPVPAADVLFTERGHRYLVMPRVPGTRLDRLGRGRGNKRRIRRALIQLAEAVAAVHEAGWVWRDCKPANVLVDQGGGISLVDFEGAARIGATNEGPWGTSPYLAASDADDREREVSTQLDIHALGVTIREALRNDEPVLRLAGTLIDECCQSPAAARPCAADVADRLRTLLGGGSGARAADA